MIESWRWLPTFSEQKCIFETAAITTNNWHIGDCKDQTAGLGTFTLSASRGKTSCTINCDVGYEKFGTGLYQCLPNANEPQGRKITGQLSCRGMAMWARHRLCCVSFSQIFGGLMIFVFVVQWCALDQHFCTPKKSFYSALWKLHVSPCTL